LSTKKLESLKVSSATLARIVGITPHALTKTIERAGIEKPAGGDWELFEFIPAYIRWVEQRKSNAPSSTKAALDTLKAEKLEFEMEIMRGEFIKADDATAIWSKVVHATRSKILGIPKKTAFLIMQCKSIPEAEDAIKKVTNNVLNELASPDMMKAAKQIQSERRAKRKKHSKL
jgi:hypothetical protein